MSGRPRRARDFAAVFGVYRHTVVLLLLVLPGVNDPPPLDQPAPRVEAERVRAIVGGGVRDGDLAVEHADREDPVREVIDAEEHRRVLAEPAEQPPVGAAALLLVELGELLEAVAEPLGGLAEVELARALVVGAAGVAHRRLLLRVAEQKERVAQARGAAGVLPVLVV